MSTKIIHPYARNPGVGYSKEFESGIGGGGNKFTLVGLFNPTLDKILVLERCGVNHTDASFAVSTGYSYGVAHAADPDDVVTIINTGTVNSIATATRDVLDGAAAAESGGILFTSTSETSAYTFQGDSRIIGVKTFPSAGALGEPMQELVLSGHPLFILPGRCFYIMSQVADVDLFTRWDWRELSAGGSV